MISPHSSGFLSSEIKSYGTELSTYSSNVSCLSKLREGVKLKVEAGTGLICQNCRGVTSMNMVAFS